MLTDAEIAEIATIVEDHLMTISRCMLVTARTNGSRPICDDRR
jgi:hypothetical protein